MALSRVPEQRYRHELPRPLSERGQLSSWLYAYLVQTDRAKRMSGTSGRKVDRVVPVIEYGPEAFAEHHIACTDVAMQDGCILVRNLYG